jgi:RNA polymerase sigma factor FliA
MRRDVEGGKEFTMPALMRDIKAGPARGTKSAQTQETLVESLLPLVRQVVNRLAFFLPTYIVREELVGAGVLGLMDAVKRYDAAKGSSLNTYCSLRIRGAILDELRQLDWVPRSVHQDARKLAQTQEKLGQILGREASEEELRAELKLSDKEYQNLLERVKPVTFFSLHEPAYGQDDPDAVLNEEILADRQTLNAAEQMLRLEDRDLILASLRRLPKAQAQVLVLYYIEDLQLKEIAQILQLTESRISQIHTLAIVRLRAMFDRERLR